MSITVGVLITIPTGSSPAPPPEKRPIGRAALMLAKEGIQVVFGDAVSAGVLTGAEAVPGGWREVRAPLHAVHDRFYSQLNPTAYAAILAELPGIPFGNASSLTALCRDKLRTQRVLEAAGVLDCPPVESDPAYFEDMLQNWGIAFLKPRYGALGRGVRRVTPGDELPTHLVSMVPHTPDPTLLQRAVLPPMGWAGCSVRGLCQRLPGGDWILNPPVARLSREDSVVNVSRGAIAAAADEFLSVETMDAVRTLCLDSARALATQPMGRLLVEVGVDVAIDTDGKPWVIEVNSRPRGRLEALAAQNPERFRTLHVDAVARPIRYLAQLALEQGIGSDAASR